MNFLTTNDLDHGGRAIKCPLEHCSLRAFAELLPELEALPVGRSKPVAVVVLSVS